MEIKNYSCTKCQTTDYKTGELRTTGSGLTRFFNIQNQKYGTVSCANCGYTELFSLDGTGFGNIVDLFTN